MFVGLSKRVNKRIHVDDAIAYYPKDEYICPVCKAPLIIKNGQINVPHFAHKSLQDCDTFTQDMSKWHRDWQNVFPKKNQEVVLTFETNEYQFEYDSYNYGFSNKDIYQFHSFLNKDNEHLKNNKLTIKHRADVLACGYVIEFQNSPISKKEFNERNWFYTSCGYKVIWIFNFVDKVKNQQISYIDEWYSKRDNGAKYKWNNAVKTFLDFLPQDHKPQYIDDKWWNGDITVFFQMAEEKTTPNVIL